MFKSLSKSVSRNPKQELARLQADYRIASFSHRPRRAQRVRREYPKLLQAIKQRHQERVTEAIERAKART